MKRFCAVMLAVITLPVFLCACAYGDVPIDAEHFPDDAFREYVRSNFDANSDNALSTAEIADVREIKVVGQEYISGHYEGDEWISGYYVDAYDITSLKGVGYFTELVSLDCSYNNNLSELDISENLKLRYLNCRSNDLSVINFRNNPNLEILTCAENHISAIYLGTNTSLRELRCQNNALTTLDVSNHPKLNILLCNSNNLTDLNINGCEALGVLWCDANNLTKRQAESP